MISLSKEKDIYIYTVSDTSVLKQWKIILRYNKITQQYNVFHARGNNHDRCDRNFTETVSHVDILKSGTQDSLLRV